MSDTFEFRTWWEFGTENLPEFFLVHTCQSAIVLVFHICGLEGLCLEDKLEEEAANGKNVDLIGLIYSLSATSHQLRRITLKRPNSVRVIVLNRMAKLIDEVPGVPKVHNPNVELRIQ
jgi:hypothetical protein